MNRKFPAWAVLLLITLCAGLALGGTFELTRDAIAAQQTAAAENARRAGLPQADTFEAIVPDAGLGLDWCYAGKKDGEIVGYAAQITVQGFGGEIEVVAGVDTAQTIRGVTVGGGSFSETPGLGAKAKESAFTDAFIGKQAQLRVVRAGEAADDASIDAITSATITSRAVVGAVNDIAKAVASLQP